MLVFGAMIYGGCALSACRSSGKANPAAIIFQPAEFEYIYIFWKAHDACFIQTTNKPLRRKSRWRKQLSSHTRITQPTSGFWCGNKHQVVRLNISYSHHTHPHIDNKWKYFLRELFFFRAPKSVWRWTKCLLLCTLRLYLNISISRLFWWWRNWKPHCRMGTPGANAEGRFVYFAKLLEGGAVVRWRSFCPSHYTLWIGQTLLPTTTLGKHFPQVVYQFSIGYACYRAYTKGKTSPNNDIWCHTVKWCAWGNPSNAFRPVVLADLLVDCGT